MCCIRVYKRKLQKANNCCHIVFQFVGGSFGVSCGQAIFNNGIIKVPTLAQHAVPEQVLSVGAYDLHGAFSGGQLMGVIRAYVVCLKHAWIMSVVPSGVTFILAFCGEWINIKANALPPGSNASDADEKQKVDSPASSTDSGGVTARIPKLDAGADGRDFYHRL